MRVRVTDIVLIAACVASLVIYGTRPETTPEAPMDRAGAELAEELPEFDAWPYSVMDESDLSDATRLRIVVDIEAPEALGAGERGQIEAMMLAAVDRHRQDWPDVVGVRLWQSHGTDMRPINGIHYAPDGCGWAGSDCTGVLWGTAVRGAVPAGLRAWGEPSPEATR